jgi:RNA recognition motif. (a.k.a. RRM, RBD, or RNP domain)
MRVRVENLPPGITAEALKKEFQRAGSCRVELKVIFRQDSVASVDYLDIVYATNAINLFNGKDFGGNKIKVTKQPDYVINLSQKRERSPSKETIALIPIAKPTLLSTNKNHQEIDLSGQIKFNSIKSTSNLNDKVKNTDLTLKNEENKLNPESSAKISAPDPVKTEKKVEIPEKKNPESALAQKNAKEAVKVVEEEVKQEKKDPPKVDIKEDDLITEIEGSKFLKTADDSKLHCIVCDKEITKKGLKAHIISKAHKSLS